MHTAASPAGDPADIPSAELFEFPQGARPAPILGTTVAGGPLRLDIAALLTTRMLVQAMSGAGKSYNLRRLIEQTHGHVQQIIVDPEDELVTLAERFDFMVCAPDSAEAPITPDRGKEAAELLFRSGRSAILSLGEFDLEDMQEFMAGFITCLMRQPKERWHHLLLVVDEAQLFAPQQDKAASKKAMIDLAGRGRKRGLCLVAATGRVAQLHKGVAGHLENKVIGRTTLDVDVERAAEQLGMRAPMARQQLGKLATGEFIAYGPALCHELTRFAVSPVETSHGALGAYAGRRVEAAMSASNVRDLLQKIARPDVSDVAGDASEGAAASVAAPVAGLSAVQAREVIALVREQVQALGVAAAAQTPAGGLQEGQAARSREEICGRVAAARMEVIRPLVECGRRRYGAVRERAKQLGVAERDIHIWLRRYMPSAGALALEPKRIRAQTTADLPCLERVLRRESAQQQGDYLELSA